MPSFYSKPVSINVFVIFYNTTFLFFVATFPPSKFISTIKMHMMHDYLEFGLSFSLGGNFVFKFMKLVSNTLQFQH